MNWKKQVLIAIIFCPLIVFVACWGAGELEKWNHKREVRKIEHQQKLRNEALKKKQEEARKKERAERPMKVYEVEKLENGNYKILEYHPY